MSKISIISKTSHNILNSYEATSFDKISLTENSVVEFFASKEDVANIQREGNSAIVTFKNGEKIILENYFDTANKSDNSIVFIDESGSIYWAKFTDLNGNITDSINYYQLENIEPLLYEDHDFAGAIWPWLGGAALVGGIAAAVSSSGGGGSGGGNKKTPEPLPKPEAVNLPAPEINPIGPKSENITGKALPNSKLTLIFPNGETVTTDVDADGNWSIPNIQGLQHEQEIKAKITDSKGNTSPETTELVDGLGPITTINNLYPNSNAITGTGEIGSTIIVTYPDGSTATTKVRNDGTWEVPKPQNLNIGDQVKAYGIDELLNEGPSVDTEYTIRPLTVESIFDDIANPSAYGAFNENILNDRFKFIQNVSGVDYDVYQTNDANPTFQGTGEPGWTVTIKKSTDVIGTAIVDENGFWSISSANLSSNAERYSFAQIDLDGVSHSGPEIIVDLKTRLTNSGFIGRSDQFLPNELSFDIGNTFTKVVVDEIKIYGRNGNLDLNHSIHLRDGNGNLIENVQWEITTPNYSYNASLKAILPNNIESGYQLFIPENSYFDYAGNVNSHYEFSNFAMSPPLVIIDRQNPQTNSFPTNMVINDPTPTFHVGIPQLYSKVLIKDKNNVVTEFIPQDRDDNEFTLNALDDGEHSYQFKYFYTQNGIEEVESPWSEPFIFTLDSSAYISSSNSDEINLGTDYDTVLYNLLSNLDNTGGNTGSSGGANGHFRDRIYDFTVSADDTDKNYIDISALLKNQNINGSNLEEYMSITQETNDGIIDSVLYIDRDGAGTDFNRIDLISFKGVQTTIDELLSNGQIIF